MHRIPSSPVLTIILLLCTFGIGTLLAEDVRITPDQRYLLLATKKTSTMQKELDEVSAKGFRVMVGSPTSGTEIAYFLERVSDSSKPYRYLLLATNRTGTMEKELNNAAQENFRLMPRSIGAKDRAFGGTEIVLLMERPHDTSDLYEYRLLATTRTRTLQKEVAEARAQGFELAALVSRGEHIVIMEKKVR